MDQHLAQFGSNVMLKKHDGVDAMVVCASKARPGMGWGGGVSLPHLPPNLKGERRRREGGTVAQRCWALESPRGIQGFKKKPLEMDPWISAFL